MVVVGGMSVAFVLGLLSVRLSKRGKKTAPGGEPKERADLPKLRLRSRRREPDDGNGWRG
ncbi:MAG: hypothetical protein J6L64_07145 [Opitutales bacterium]|nr:hypothetical protein [Opitutales bacterium]